MLSGYRPALRCGASFSPLYRTSLREFGRALATTRRCCALRVCFYFVGWWRSWERERAL